MKKILFSITFLLLFAFSVFATEVTVSSFTNPQWRYGGSTATLRAYLSNQLVTSDNQMLMPSRVGPVGWYKEVSCTVSGATVSCPSFTIDSTTDSSVPTAKFTLVWWDSRGTMRDTLGTFRIPPTPTPTTISALVLYNAASAIPLSTTYYTGDQVDTLLSGLDLAPKASDVIFGKIILDVPPADSSNPTAVGKNSYSSTSNLGVLKLDTAPDSASAPIAVGKNSYSSISNLGVLKTDVAPASASSPIATGINSPQVTKNTKVLGADYATLADAITAISTTPTTLTIKNDISVASTTNLTSSGIRLRFENGAKITVASGQTLTIGKMDDPGNVQIFAQADATSNIRFASGAVDKINIAWFLGATPTLATNAINQALASVSTNGGGSIYLPGDGSWTTAGDHATVSNLKIAGDGIGTILKATTAGNSKGVFKQTNVVFGVTLENLTINGDNGTTSGVTGFLFTGTGAEYLGHTTFKNVRITDCANGIYFYDSAGADFQTMNVHCVNCWIEGNDIGLRSNSGNNVLNFTGKIDVGPGQKAASMTKFGQWSFHGVEFAGFPAKNGIEQVETGTVAITAVTVGNAKSVVTAAGLPGSPVTVSIPLVGGETAAQVAAKFRKGLGNDPNLFSFFHVAGTNAEIELIPIARAANDATFNFTIEDDTSGGITDAVTSANTVAGVTDTNNVGGFEVSGAHGPLTFYGGVSEGFSYFLSNNADDFNSVISLFGFQLQDPIILNNFCSIQTTGSIIDNKMIRGVTAGARYTSTNDFINTAPYLGGGFRTLSVMHPTNFSGSAVTGDASVSAVFIDHGTSKILTGYPLTAFVGEDVDFSLDDDRGVLEALESENNSYNRNQLIWGRANALGIKQFYFGVKRSNSDGRSKFTGNQTPRATYGYDFDSDVTATGLLATGTVGVGYTTGAGGTVTQITSRTTGVTLNKTTGQITLFSVAGSASYQTFTVTNSTVAAADTVVISQKSGADKYLTFVTAVGAGSFAITFATTGGTTVESPVFNFAVIKGASS